MKGDQRLRREKVARKEMDHALRQVNLFRDRLTARGSDPLTEAAYRGALIVLEEKRRAFEALELHKV